MGRDEDPIVAAKQRIRAAVLATRAERSADELEAAGTAIARLGLDRWDGAAMVAAYLSMDDEPPTRRLIDELTTRGTQVVVPVIDGDELDWAVYEAGSGLAKSSLGIDEPTGTRLGRQVLSQVEVVLVPAIAVDARGVRLGRGRGYYDRALADIHTDAVAVVFDDELLDDVPAEPHDRRVNGVLRPAGYASF